MHNFRIWSRIEHVAFVLCMGCAPALAQTWVMYESTGDSAAFLDVESIRSDGSHVLAWQLADFTTPQRTSDGVYKSVVAQYVIDCEKGESGTREIVFYPDHIGAGEGIKSYSFPKGEERMREAPPGSIGAKTVQEVCRFVQRGTTTPSTLDKAQILLGRDKTGLLTLTRSYVLGLTKEVRVGVVGHSIFHEQTLPPSAIRSTCMPYAVDCTSRSVVRRPTDAHRYSQIACDGKSLGTTKYVVSRGDEESKWERRLIDALCETSVTEYSSDAAGK